MRQIFNFQFSIFNYKKGFTLIELLVVIAVVGIVSAAIFAAINVAGNLNKANLANAKTFAASLENSLAINQVGKWSFEESASPSKDTSGYGNDGVWSGGVSWQDSNACGLGFGGCVSFDGTTGYISIPDNDFIDFSVNQEFTVSVWIKAPVNQNDTASDPNSIVEKWSGNLDGYPYVIRIYNQTSPNNGKIHALRYDGSVLSHHPTIVSTKRINDNNFHHIVFTKKGTMLYLYIDGVQDSSPVLDTTTGTTTNNSPLFLGQRGSNIRRYTGVIDEVQIYSQALLSSQIRQLYARGLPKHQLASK